ncbi:MAG: class I SAM-dependent methyltransferase [Methanospirillaceae archaeon]|nr:class I SAM-dependent methyltransferase [Methanospirillaceae archaeon]
MEEVKRAFDGFADEYDAQREFVIPDLRQFYGTAVWAAEPVNTPPAILDLGAGTGLMSAFLLQKFPDARITLMDFSEQMLEVARKRFLGMNNIEYIVNDYRSAYPGGPYDIVCSALSIHHLETIEKKRLFQTIYDALVPGGMFVNADQAEGETPYFSARNREWWLDYIRSGSLSGSEEKDMLIQRSELDKNEKLSLQLQWLRDCGFVDVDVVYKNRTYIVTVSRR